MVLGYRVKPLLPGTKYTTWAASEWQVHHVIADNTRETEPRAKPYLATPGFKIQAVL
jgi:hypothetical protein